MLLRCNMFTLKYDKEGRSTREGASSLVFIKHKFKFVFDDLVWCAEVSGVSDCC